MCGNWLSGDADLGVACPTVECGYSPQDPCLSGLIPIAPERSFHCELTANPSEVALSNRTRDEVLASIATLTRRLSGQSPGEDIQRSFSGESNASPEKKR
jgi:hypothetical protein